MAVGNVPFGQYHVRDKAYDKLGFSIHNYFFAKALDQIRPGGVVAFVTSRYTMDAKDSSVRKYLAQRAELLGAIRLPNNAFRANAGTDVVSDIIFLQKRDRPIDIEPEWVQTAPNEDGFTINSYFVEHPEMILGRQSSDSTQYGRQDFTVEPIEGLELADQLHDAVKYIRGSYREADLPDLGEDEQIRDTLPADPDVKNFSFTLVDGEVYFRNNSIMVKPDLNATAKARVKGMVCLRDCVRELIDMQMDEFATDDAITDKQAELNRLYDSYTAKYGLINDTTSGCLRTIPRIISCVPWRSWTVTVIWNAKPIYSPSAPSCARAGSSTLIPPWKRSPYLLARKPVWICTSWPLSWAAMIRFLRS